MAARGAAEMLQVDAQVSGPASAVLCTQSGHATCATRVAIKCYLVCDGFVTCSLHINQESRSDPDGVPDTVGPKSTGQAGCGSAATTICPVAAGATLRQVYVILPGFHDSEHRQTSEARPSQLASPAGSHILARVGF